MEKAVSAEVEAGMEWGALKRTILRVPGGKNVSNPYHWRAWFSKTDCEDWAEPLRKSGAS
jgi:hypothetical protein